MFFVSVAFKGLRYCASSLFATLRRELRSVASKGLRLHQNCAEFGHCRCFSVLRVNWRVGRGGRGIGGAERRLREARGETNRARWRLTIKDYDRTEVMMLSRMDYIII